MKESEEHIVPKLDSPTRLQDYAVNIFTKAPTKSAIKKAIKKEAVLLNGEIANTGDWLYGGEIISLLETEGKISDKIFHIDLNILFEDDFLAIVYKPAGVLVNGNSFATIQNALPNHLKPSKQNDAVKPQPVHRLDYPTSGLLLIGKTQSVITQLSKLFENKEIQKTYLAIAIGEMEKLGSITKDIDDKSAESNFEVLSSVSSERFQQLNLVKLSPKTGRKHQLRKHLAFIGNPILGDKEYGLTGKILKGKGLYLHAYSLKFIHPISREKIKIQSPPSNKFYSIFPSLNQHL